MSDTRTLWIAALGRSWPELLDGAGTETVLGWLATRHDLDRDPPSAFVGDLALALGCSVGHVLALELFDQKLLARLGAYVGRIDSSPGFVDELRQTLREHLLVGSPPRIAEYTGRGSLEGWVRVTSTRMALRMKQRQPELAAAPPSEVPDPRSAAGDPETAFLKHRYRDELNRALSAVVASLPADERAWLKLYYLDELTVEQIGGLYRVHASTVWRRLRALEARVLDGLREEIQQRLRVGAHEVDSLIGLVRSQLHMSLSGALGTRE